VKLENIEIEKLIPAECNVRNHSEEQIKEMIRSVEQFGQIRPIIVDEKNILIAGHGLLLALKKMKWKKVNVLRLNNLSQNKKYKLMLADNKIYDMGTGNTSNIMTILEQLNKSNDLDIPGFEVEILLDLLSDTKDIDEIINNYGKVSDEKSEEIKDNIEEQHQRKSADQTEMRLTNQNIKWEIGEDGERIIFILCPDCGTKICL